MDLIREAGRYPTGGNVAEFCSPGEFAGGAPFVCITLIAGFEIKTVALSD